MVNRAPLNRFSPPVTSYQLGTSLLRSALALDAIKLASTYGQNLWRQNGPNRSAKPVGWCRLLFSNSSDTLRIFQGIVHEINLLYILLLFKLGHHHNGLKLIPCPPFIQKLEKAYISTESIHPCRLFSSLLRYCAVTLLLFPSSTELISSFPHRNYSTKHWFAPRDIASPNHPSPLCHQAPISFNIVRNCSWSKQLRVRRENQGFRVERGERGCFG